MLWRQGSKRRRLQIGRRLFQKQRGGQGFFAQGKGEYTKNEKLGQKLFPRTNQNHSQK